MLGLCIWSTGEAWATLVQGKNKPDEFVSYNQTTKSQAV
jgi:hypothetical protein